MSIFSTRNFKATAFTGAAFLMATSAIGPGFITQTTVFTNQLTTSFGFVILVSILLDIGAQLNIWRIITVSEMRAQDLANKLLPGIGYFLTALIVLGGISFNIGNIAGAGLGLNVLTGLDVRTGAIISALIGIAIFSFKEAGTALDNFTKILGFVMIGLTLYVAVSSAPPVGQALVHTVIPEKLDTIAIITLVGGTVGGYITFAGAHRLIDANVKGIGSIKAVSRSSVTAILLASLMRILLFLAALGVVMSGIQLDPSNPPASVFSAAAGEIGYKIFGVVLWSAAITSVVGAAYTSVSFMKSFHPWLQKQHSLVTILFIAVSALLFAWIGQPVKMLILAGTLNGLILPIALGIVLVAAYRKDLMKQYQHPAWMSVAGWIVVAVMGSMASYSIWKFFN